MKRYSIEINGKGKNKYLYTYEQCRMFAREHLRLVAESRFKALEEFGSLKDIPDYYYAYEDEQTIIIREKEDNKRAKSVYKTVV